MNRKHQFAESLESRAYLTAVSFASPVDISTATAGITPVSALLADFTGDGKSDLVVANSSTSDSVSVLTGNGDGTFGSATALPVLGSPVALATGQFDTTKHTDIVVGTDDAPGNITIIPGNGNGTFAAANNFAALNNNSEIAVGDFNNDGDTDVLTVSDSSSADLAMILLGNGADGLFPQTPFSLPFGSVSAVAVGDFKGDGDLGFVVANQQNNSVSVFLGNGDGTFQAPVTYATGPDPTSLAIGNFSGKTLTNGKPELDIVTGDGTAGEISYLANNGDGTYAAPVNTKITGSAAGGGPISLATGDFRDDGKTDLLALLSPGGTADAAVLLSNGNGIFISGSTIVLGNGTQTFAAAGDLNDDNFSDVLLGNSSQISTLLNSAANSVTASTTTLQAAPSAGVNVAIPISATVAPASGTAVPTGSVTFTSNGVFIGQATLTSGTATLTTTFTATGTDSIVADYSGDANFAASASAPATITVDIPVPAVTPSVVRSTLPTTLVSGSAAHGTFVVNATNQTPAAVNGLITLNVYATTDYSVDAGAVLVGTIKRKLSIKPGKFAKLSVSIKLPNTLPAGSYTLLAQASDPAGNIAVAATGPALTVAAPFIALAETFTKLTLPVSAVTGSKTSAIALLRITNSGNVASAGITPVGLYISADATSADETLITSSKRKLVIGAGKSITLRVPLGAFPPSVDGSDSIIAQVTDPDGEVSSVISSTTVNLAAANIDLAATAITVPTTGKIGSSVLATLSFSNNGNVVAAGVLQIAFSVSPVADGSNSVPLETISERIKVNPAASQKLRIKILVVKGITAGSEFVVADLDPNDTFAELNLLNNVAVSATAITLN